jgi:uncharacterized BrkB/YihY/UPF0761 family membrane protein
MAYFFSRGCFIRVSLFACLLSTIGQSSSETYGSVGQLVRLLGWGIGLTQDLYLHRTTQHRKTRTYIHASSGIRNHNPSFRAAEDSTCLRPFGHWDRRSVLLLLLLLLIIIIIIIIIIEF